MYWLNKDGLSEGPLTEGEARARIESGCYKLHHLVWVVGSPAWRPLAEIPLLTQDSAASERRWEGAVTARPPPIPPNSCETSRTFSHEHRPLPLRRYGARTLDVAFLGAVCDHIFPAYDASLFSVHSLLLGVTSMSLQIPIETYCLSYFQTTLGKAFFGITVLRRDGCALTRAEAFERAARAHIFGSALQLQWIGPICQFLTYLDLRSPHGATWDRATQSVVWYETKTALRQLAGTLLLGILTFSATMKLIFG